MTYKAKAYRGGAVFNADGTPYVEGGKRLRYPCFATGCPMPGTMWTQQLDNGSHPPGSCYWHYAVNPSDIPRVTQVLKDWGPLSYEIDECRRVHTSSESACDPRMQEQLFATAIERLRPFVQAGGWKDDFESRGRSDSYANWGRRAEAFLGARVVEVLSVHQRRAA